MQQIKRLFWMVMLCAFLSGCSTYRSVSLPRSDSTAVSNEAEETVKTGWSVRIALRSGESVSGEVSQILDESLALGKLGNYGYEERIIKFGEVESIEVEQASGVESVVMISVAAVAVLGLFAGLALAGTLSSLD